MRILCWIVNHLMDCHSAFNHMQFSNGVVHVSHPSGTICFLETAAFTFHISCKFILYLSAEWKWSVRGQSGFFSLCWRCQNVLKKQEQRDKKKVNHPKFDDSGVLLTWSFVWTYVLPDLTELSLISVKSLWEVGDPEAFLVKVNISISGKFS
jgi:hypothetical protein